jgi:uncharacterized protein YndB with AHSA1/START domain
MSQQVIAPVVKSVVVGLPVEAAFQLLTAKASRWWPLASHSVGGEDAVSCTLEGRVGGRFYEVMKDGSQSEWGRVLVWEPPHRLVLSFYPGRDPASAGEVEITFREEPGGTRLTLVHRGWERYADVYGEKVLAMRDGYDSGWEYVLGKYLAFSASE